MDEKDPVEERKELYRQKYKSYNDVPTLCRMMRAVQTIKEDLEEQLKAVNAEFDVLRLELIPTKCEEQGIDSMRIDGLGRLSLTADIYVSVKTGRHQEFYRWLEMQNLGDLVKPAINSSTLKAFVKGRIKKGDAFPDDVLNVTPFTRASITKAS